MDKYSLPPEDFYAFLYIETIIFPLPSCIGWSDLPQSTLCHAALYTFSIIGIHAPSGHSS